MMCISDIIFWYGNRLRALSSGIGRLCRWAVLDVCLLQLLLACGTKVQSVDLSAGLAFAGSSPREECEHGAKGTDGKDSRRC